jgi:hypothetical protein
MRTDENQFITEENMTTQKAKESGDLTCPECEKAGKTATFKDKRGLGLHRRFTHGIRGTSPSSVSFYKRHDESKKTKATHQAKYGSYHKQTAIVPATAATVETQIKPAGISVAMLGYAMGRLESLAEQIARENGLPEKEFVKQTAANLAELTKR